MAKASPQERTMALVKARAAVEHINSLGTRYITPDIIYDLADGFVLLDNERGNSNGD